MCYLYVEEKYWYWEVIETIRRLLMTGALVLVGQNSTMQIVVAIVLSQVFIKLYAFYQPFHNQKIDFLSEVAMYQVFIALFIFLLLRNDGFKSNNEILCDVCLVIASIMLVFADLADACSGFVDSDFYMFKATKKFSEKIFPYVISENNNEKKDKGEVDEKEGVNDSNVQFNSGINNTNDTANAVEVFVRSSADNEHEVV
jgi:hypothetical protein